MADYYQRRGDTLPPLAATLTDKNRVAVDLSTATSIRFKMRSKLNGQQKVDAAASFVSKPAGTVRYDWVSADLNEAGVFLAEWEVMFGASGPMTFPKPGYLEISVDADN